MYNGVLTSMLLSSEYLKFSTERKGLRVTNPTGAQRCTYWLQLPYRYAVPLTVAMAVLNWLTSQSLFYVRLSVFDYNFVLDPSQTVNGTEWSPNAVVATLTIALCMILALPILGFKKIPERDASSWKQ